MEVAKVLMSSFSELSESKSKYMATIQIITIHRIMANDMLRFTEDEHTADFPKYWGFSLENWVTGKVMQRYNNHNRSWGAITASTTKLLAHGHHVQEVLSQEAEIADKIKKYEELLDAAKRLVDAEKAVRLARKGLGIVDDASEEATRGGNVQSSQARNSIDDLQTKLREKAEELKKNTIHCEQAKQEVKIAESPVHDKSKFRLHLVIGVNLLISLDPVDRLKIKRRLLLDLGIFCLFIFTSDWLSRNRTAYCLRLL
ncbi:hypothetical protein CHU98_g3865 [Xylaria longipes]|nr:hypothetical protein CHU98_g3865 [Xylaria longipes]